MGNRVSSSPKWLWRMGQDERDDDRKFMKCLSDNHRFRRCMLGVATMLRICTTPIAFRRTTTTMKTAAAINSRDEMIMTMIDEALMVVCLFFSFMRGWPKYLLSGRTRHYHFVPPATVLACRELARTSLSWRRDAGCEWVAPEHSL